ncbi:MAG: tetratricopeptide repeat protein [Balneolaceae bacterium]|nr:tetratricopeptide repeat protein [Balneolaceae bacterium]
MRHIYTKGESMVRKCSSILFIAVFCSIQISTAQTQSALVDSLNQRISQSSDEAQIIRWKLEIGSSFQQTNPDTLISIAQEAYTMAEQLGDDQLFIESGLLIGRGMIRSGDYTPALAQFNDLLARIDALNNPDHLSFRAEVVRGIGNIYFIQFQQELSLEYYADASAIYEELNDTLRMGSLYDNIASAHLELENFELAEEFYLKALDLHTDNENVMSMASTQVNLALLYDRLQRRDRTVYFATLALNTAKEQNALIMESYAVRILGSVSYQNKDYQSALNYYQRSLEIANELEIPYEQKDSYLNLSRIYEDLGDYKNAYEHYVQHKVFNDSLINQQSANKLAELRAEYETTEQQREIELLEKEQELQSARLISISSGLGSVLLVVLITALFFINKKRKEIELLEKDRIIADSKKRIAEEELANARLREENLQKELTNYALHIVEKNDFLEEVKSEMNEIRTEIKNSGVLKQINKLGSKIYQNLMINKDREEFEIQVEQACDGFFKSLEQQYPNLTNQERRLAALLRLNLSSKEISGILNISPKSVDQSRYRLRKKLDLPKSENLGVFLNQV